MYGRRRGAEERREGRQGGKRGESQFPTRSVLSCSDEEK